MSKLSRILFCVLALILAAGTCFAAPLANPLDSRPLARPSISITAPAGNETWPAMTIHTIRWTYSGQISSGKLDLYLLHDGKPVFSVTNMINIGTGGHGSYDYLLPAPTLPGSNYQILLVPQGQNPSTATLKATSKPFTVSQQPSIEVLEPNASTVWQSPSTRLIRWKYVGQPASMVRIELLGDSTKLVIAESPIGAGGTGSYSWKIPASVHGKFQLSVLSTENGHVFQHISPHFIIKPLIIVKPDLPKAGTINTGPVDQLDPQPEPPMR